MLLHGIGCRWQHWLPVLDELANHHDVIALDLPGFGFSPRPATAPEAGAAPLARIVAAFLQELGVVRPHVAGNSLGGWVALELAREGLVRSVIALSPAGFYTQAEAIFLLASLKLARFSAVAGRATVARAMRPAWLRRAAQWQFYQHGDRLDRFDAAENLRALADCTWWEETLDAIVRERFHLGRPLDLPVTIGWGEHDRVLPYRQAARAISEIPGARLITLTGCGHLPMGDDPRQVAQVILEGAATDAGRRG